MITTPPPDQDLDDDNVPPCVGICIVDESGNCIGCGRPAEAATAEPRGTPEKEVEHEH